jgi:hypothetical protein
MVYRDGGVISLELLVIYPWSFLIISNSWSSMMSTQRFLANFEQNKDTHISNHIWEWRRQKSLIKAMVPPKFILEWFLNSLLPYISKDVVTLRVFTEEKVIFREK